MELKLVKWDLALANRLAILANDEMIASKLTNAFPFPYTLDDANAYIKQCIDNEKTQLCLALLIDDKLAGSIGVFFKDDVHQKSAELGYWLGKIYWSKGIMSKAVRLFCDYIFENYDIVRIYAKPFSNNKGSMRVLEKAGFNKEGILKYDVFKQGQLLDSVLYAKVKGESL